LAGLRVFGLSGGRGQVTAMFRDHEPAHGHGAARSREREIHLTGHTSPVGTRISGQLI